MGPGSPRAKENVGQRDNLEKTTAGGADPYSPEHCQGPQLQPFQGLKTSQSLRLLQLR